MEVLYQQSHLVKKKQSITPPSSLHRKTNISNQKYINTISPTRTLVFVPSAAIANDTVKGKQVKIFDEYPSHLPSRDSNICYSKVVGPSVYIGGCDRISQCFGTVSCRAALICQVECQTSETSWDLVSELQSFWLIYTPNAKRIFKTQNPR